MHPPHTVAPLPHTPCVWLELGSGDEEESRSIVSLDTGTVMPKLPHRAPFSARAERRNTRVELNGALARLPRLVHLAHRHFVLAALAALERPDRAQAAYLTPVGATGPALSVLSASASWNLEFGVAAAVLGLCIWASVLRLVCDPKWSHRPCTAYFGGRSGWYCRVGLA